jgi:hypothetical protein
MLHTQRHKGLEYLPEIPPARILIKQGTAEQGQPAAYYAICRNKSFRPKIKKCGPKRRLKIKAEVEGESEG